MMGKVPKGEEKIRGKKGKTAKCAEEENNESTYSFQNCDSRQVLMFLYHGWYLQKEKETSFLTLCMVNFGLTATSLFKSGRRHGAPPLPVAFTREVLFLFLTDWYSLFFDRLVLFLSSLSPFFFLFFFTNDFLPLLIFHTQRFFLKQKAFTSEFCKVFDVSKIRQ